MQNLEVDPPLQSARLELETDLTVTKTVLQWFEQFKSDRFSVELWMQARVALIEGFTNAVRHAHAKRSRTTPIQVEVKLWAHQIEIQVWDEGAGFDLDQLLNTVEQCYPNPLEHEAHWGGTILKKLRDQDWQIQYFCPAEEQRQRNCLWMRKRF